MSSAGHTRSRRRRDSEFTTWSYAVANSVADAGSDACACIIPDNGANHTPNRNTLLGTFTEPDSKSKRGADATSNAGPDQCTFARAYASSDANCHIGAFTEPDGKRNSEPDSKPHSKCNCFYSMQGLCGRAQPVHGKK